MNDSESLRSENDTIIEEESSLRKNSKTQKSKIDINKGIVPLGQFTAEHLVRYTNNSKEHMKNSTIKQKSTHNATYLGKIKNLFKHHLRNVTYVPYLTAEKKASLIQQLKQAKDKLLQKQSKFLDSIKEAIISNDIEAIKHLMLSKQNKQFYKRQLQDSNFLPQMLIGNKFLMLQLVLTDPYYKFDELFIFTYLCGELNKKDQKLNSCELKDIIEKVINMKLFKSSLIKVLAWLICCFDFIPLFIQLVQKNQKLFCDIEAAFNGFLDQGEAMDYYNNNSNFNKTIIICLKENCQQYAIELVKYNNQLNSDEVINTAIKSNSRLFLKFVWEKCFKANEDRDRDRDKEKDSEKDKAKEPLVQRNNAIAFNNGTIVYYISSIILQINSLLTNRDFIYEIITGWNYLNKDAQLMKTLFEIKAYDEISILLFRYSHIPEWKFTQDDCLRIIYNKGIQLTLHCLTLKECIRVLEKSKTQKYLVDHYLETGETIYYAAEMLSYISLNNIDLSLTYEMMNKIDQAIKTKRILNCHSPILTCMLLSEMALKIGNRFLLYKARCQRTKQALVVFCKNIYETNHDERYIKYLLMQKDSRGRAAYQIASEPELFTVLDSPEIGTIVSKLWTGRLSYDSLIFFSSIVRYLENPSSKGPNPVDNFIRYDKSKIYYHQFGLWIESCSIRYFPEPLNNILLLILFNIFIIQLSCGDLIVTSYKDLPIGIRTLMYIYIAWVGIKCLGILLHFIFCVLTKKRRFDIKVFGYFPFVSLIFGLLLLIDVPYYFPSYDIDFNIIPSNNKSDLAFVIRASLLSINTICVWLQSSCIFVTYKELGPLIRMITSLGIVTVKYLFIYLFFTICCATIFVSFFYKTSPQFDSFSSTYYTLFSGYLKNFNCFDFERHQIFGATMINVYVIITGLLLVSLLIALLSNEYMRLSKEVDVAQRSVYVHYFNQYKWDKDYGYLILLPCPLNIISYFFLLINVVFITSDEQKKYNLVISKIYFSLFFFPTLFLIFTIATFIMIPYCYFQSLYWKINYEYQRKDKDALVKVANCFLWTIVASGVLFRNYFIDIIDVFRTLFADIDVNTHDYEKYRIKHYITSEDIRTFLQFIHKRDKGEPNDLHTIFIDYLDFVEDRKSEKERLIKQQGMYLQKLKSTRSKRFSYSFPLYSLDFENNKGRMTDKESKNRQEFIQRNFVIIETLENFLIDDATDNFIVDIEKMKMLLPNTMNINNAYKKRMIFTDISSISKAINRMRKNTDAFLQQKLISKIAGGTIRLDKTIDLPRNNEDPLQSDEVKIKNKIDIQDNEDDFYSTLEDMLKKLCSENGEKMKKMEEKIIEEEISLGLSPKKTSKMVLNTNEFSLI